MTRKIIAKPLEWAHPMNNAWSANFLGGQMQILTDRDGDYRVIVDPKFGGGISTAADKLETTGFEDLRDAKENAQKFMDEVVNSVAMLEPEGQAEC